MKECPYCAEEVQDKAIKCKHCGEWFYKSTPEEYFIFDKSNRTITGCIGKNLKDIVIPSSIGGVSVINIGAGAFMHNQLTTVTIPDSVVMIGSGSFTHNQLTNIIIPDGVKIIGLEAFSHNRLTSITIPTSVKIIGSWAFKDNPLEGVVIPDSVVDVGEDVFDYTEESGEQDSYYPDNEGQGCSHGEYGEDCETLISDRSDWCDYCKNK